MISQRQTNPPLTSVLPQSPLHNRQSSIRQGAMPKRSAGMPILCLSPHAVPTLPRACSCPRQTSAWASKSNPGPKVVTFDSQDVKTFGDGHCTLPAFRSHQGTLAVASAARLV